MRNKLPVKLSFLIVTFVLMLLFGLGVLLLTIGEKETRASEYENRMLQGMPELTSENFFSGDFSGQFENFLLDGFMGRNAVIDVSQSVLDAFSVQTLEDKILLENNDDELQGLDKETESEPEIPSLPVPETPDEVEDVVDETPEEPENVVPDDSAEVEEAVNSGEAPTSGGFYYVKSDGGLKVQFYTASNYVTLTANALNAYRSELPEDGNVFYAMIPLKQNYEPLVGNPKYTGWTSDTEEALQAQVVDGVHIVNAPEVLQPHLDEDIYFPFDHHWSALGAYYVAAELVRIQGLPVTPYYEYDYKTITNNGSWFEVMYPLEDISAFKIYGKTREYESHYMNYNNDTYMAYVTGVLTPWTRFETGFSTGRKALVIGDSFANAMVSYLWPYYDEVHMTDIRQTYYDVNEAGGWVAELMELHDIDDVYIIFSYANSAHSPTSYERLLRCLYG
ncbi:MAG: hypothetical protein IKV79_06695 [Oscillospiraceae bacterium]|nr:hypothetical protein [Oscillospiraceae bacterium]